jgi:hypothetical protein
VYMVLSCHRPRSWASAACVTRRANRCRPRAPPHRLSSERERCALSRMWSIDAPTGPKVLGFHDEQLQSTCCPSLAPDRCPPEPRRGQPPGRPCGSFATSSAAFVPIVVCGQSQSQSRVQSSERDVASPGSLRMASGRPPPRRRAGILSVAHPRDSLGDTLGKADAGCVAQ